jgi:hypothetical protein
VHENEKVSHEDRLYGFYQYLREPLESPRRPLQRLSGASEEVFKLCSLSALNRPWWHDTHIQASTVPQTVYRVGQSTAQRL